LNTSIKSRINITNTFEKLDKEKQLIDSGRTTHNERDTANINRQLNGLNSIYISFMNAINNIP